MLINPHLKLPTSIWTSNVPLLSLKKQNKKNLVELAKTKDLNGTYVYVFLGLPHSVIQWISISAYNESVLDVKGNTEMHCIMNKYTLS